MIPLDGTSYFSFPPSKEQFESFLSFVNSSKTRSLHNNKNNICLGWEDPLEEGMATYSSILAWRIPMDGGAWRAPVRGLEKCQAWLGDEAQHRLWVMIPDLLLASQLQAESIFDKYPLSAYF